MDIEVMMREAAAAPPETVPSEAILRRVRRRRRRRHAVRFIGGVAVAVLAGVLVAELPRSSVQLRAASPGGADTVSATPTGQIAVVRDDGIYLIDAATGAQRQATSAELPSDPVWSPDGMTLAFEQYRPAGVAVSLVRMPEGATREVVAGPDKDADGPDGIVGDSFPMWLSNTELAYPAPTDDWQPLEIAMVSVSGDALRSPTPAPFYYQSTSTRGDIVVARRGWQIGTEGQGATTQDETLTLLRADGTEQVLAPAAAGGVPQFSPDGSRVAYERPAAEPGGSDICIAVIADASTFCLTASTGWNTHPTWSPDGQHIAFAHRTGGADGPSTVKVLSLNGKHEADLGPGDSPAWRP